MKSSIEIRKDFPIFFGEYNMAYLDSAATTQKPKVVIDELSQFYATSNANPHRGVYKLSMFSSFCLNSARHAVAKLINSELDENIVFTKNSTESLNLVAYSYGMDNVKAGDNVVVSIMEHHSNLVPWQRLCKKVGAELRYLYIDDTLNIPSSELGKIDDRTKVVCITAGSNVFGTIVDVKRIVKVAHSFGAKVVCDATQYIAHLPFDVNVTDVDFMAFSGHKMYAPLGVGVLYVKKELLDNMSPFMSGGDMIDYVTEQETTYATLPNRFEAGTINLSSIVGLEKAISYLNSLGSYDAIISLEQELLKYAITRLRELDYVELYLPKGDMLPVISFNVKGVHPHDVASILDMADVCIRSGNHCAQPLLRSRGLDSTCRISLGIYNTKEDIDRLIAALEQVKEIFSKYLKKYKK